jgi:formylglycine-generating enzyme required for sulfatase activity
MRTKNFLFSLLLAGAAGVMSAHAQKPKLAVLVVGMGSVTKSDDFAARLGSDLNRDNEYTLVTKDDNAVANKLTELHAAHTPSTPVDTSGLAAWGKANKIDFVQLVVERTTAGTIILPAQVERVGQLVDCSTGKLSGRGTYRMSFTLRETAGPQMVRVTGGVFEMGCKTGRDNKTTSCVTRETPVHYVKVNDFSIGKYPVTQAEWKAVMGWLPSNFTSNTAYLGDNKPVVYVSHDDIVGDTGFLKKLNALTGKSYRLPTEAEWEYAARGCEARTCENFEFSGSDNLTDVGWYSSNRPSANAQPVGGKLPNRLGIYDMSGNVWEWCSDWYDVAYYPSGTTESTPLDNPENTTPGSARVLRGGSWNYAASINRAAVRADGVPGTSFSDRGFRLVLP